MDKLEEIMDLPEEAVYEMLQEVYQASGKGQSITKEEEGVEVWLMLQLLERIRMQLKRGLYKTYVSMEAPLTQIRGKVDMHQSIKLRTELSRQLHCQFDLFDQDNLYNQIIKGTCLYVLRQGRMSQEVQKELKRMLLKLQAIKEIPLRAISWQSIRFHKDKVAYRQLIGLCYILVKGLKVSLEGKVSLRGEVLKDLYEQFIEAFYVQRVSEVCLEEKEFSGEGSFMRRSCRNKDRLLRCENETFLLRTHLWTIGRGEESRDFLQKELEGLKEAIKDQQLQRGEIVKGILMVPYWKEMNIGVWQELSSEGLKVYGLNLMASKAQMDEQLRSAIG